MIGLFELAGQKRRAMEDDQGRARAGRACLVFYCDDLTTLHQRLVNGGHDVITPPIPFQAPGRQKQLEMTCLDPDGMMINIIERMPEGAFAGS